METTVLKTDLMTALKNAYLIVGKNKKEPIINHVKLEAVGEKLVISATDYGQIFIESIIADNQQPGKTIAPAKKFMDIVKMIDGDEINISVTPQNWMYLKSGKTKVRIPAMDAEHFPSCEIKRGSIMFGLEPEQLKDVFDKTYTSIGDNESRKNLMGLNIKNAGRDIIFTGADSFRITRFKIEGIKKGTKKKDFDLIFPKKGLNNVTKLFKKTDTKFYSNDYFIQVEGDSMQYQSRLIEADFPNLDRLMEPLPKMATADAEPLVNSMKMLKFVVEQDRHAVLKMSLNGSMVLESQKLEFGEASTEIDCEYESTDFVCGLNIMFFNEMLAPFNKQAKICINVKDVEAPILFSSPTIENYKSVLMPVRIQW